MLGVKKFTEQSISCILLIEKLYDYDRQVSSKYPKSPKSPAIHGNNTSTDNNSIHMIDNENDEGEQSEFVDRIWEQLLSKLFEANHIYNYEDYLKLLCNMSLVSISTTNFQYELDHYEGIHQSMIASSLLSPLLKVIVNYDHLLRKDILLAPKHNTYDIPIVKLLDSYDHLSSVSLEFYTMKNIPNKELFLMERFFIHLKQIFPMKSLKLSESLLGCSASINGSGSGSNSVEYLSYHCISATDLFQSIKKWKEMIQLSTSSLKTSSSRKASSGSLHQRNSKRELEGYDDDDKNDNEDDNEDDRDIDNYSKRMDGKSQQHVMILFDLI
jgi:hypothetical protein